MNSCKLAVYSKVGLYFNLYIKFNFFCNDFSCLYLSFNE